MQPLPGEEPGRGRGGAALSWGWGEDCEPLHHSLLPDMVPLLVLRKDYQIFVGEIKIISGQIDVEGQSLGVTEGKMGMCRPTDGRDTGICRARGPNPSRS